jgi:hypothetical protein
MLNDIIFLKFCRKLFGTIKYFLYLCISNNN